MVSLKKAGTSGGASAFINLTDVPNSYNGEAGKYVRVASGENGLEFTSQTSSELVTFVNTNYTVQSTDTMIVVNSQTNNRTITIPTTEKVNGRKITIKCAGYSSINPIVIMGEGQELIDGEIFYMLNSNYDCVTLFCDGTVWWVGV